MGAAQAGKQGYNMGIRKYKINEYFFHSWSAEMSYILGLWWADGSICNLNGKIRDFNITLKDEEELLTKIATLINPGIPLREHKTSGAFALKICSEIICTQICALGGMTNKSKVIGWPNNIPVEFIPDFIRGYFDGDGCIYNKEGKTWRTSFASGSLIFLQSLQSNITQLDSEIVGIIVQEKSWFKLDLNQKESKHLAKLIYSNQNNLLYIDRKYQKFVQMFNEKGQQDESLQCKLTTDKVNNIINSIKSGYYTNLTNICEDYKICKTTIEQIFSRKSWKSCTEQFTDPELQDLKSKVVGKHNYYAAWAKR